MLDAPGPSETPPAASRLDIVIEVLMTALLVALPLARGAVDAWGEMMLLSIGAAIAVLLVIRRVIVPEIVRGQWIVWTPIALFVALAIAQLIPLPASTLKTIAPGTYALKAELLGDLPDALSRMTITFYALGTRHDLRIVLLAITIFATVLTIYRQPARIQRLLMAITLVGAVTALWALVQGERAPSGPFFNHSHYGQFMNLCIAAAAALLLMRPTRWANSLPLAAFILLGWFTIYLSGTRGGVISAAAAGALMCLALLLGRRTGWIIAAAVVFIAAGSIALWQFRNDGRFQIARDVLVMARHFGRTGTGLGTFEFTYTMFDRTDALNVTTHADNEYVQMLAEIGWGGLAIVLLFAGVIWWYWLRAVASRQSINRVLAIGAGYGLLAVMIHSLTDFGQHIAANACLSAMMCGLIVNVSAGASARTRSSGRIGHIIVAIAAIAVAAWGVVAAVRSSNGEAHATLARRVANTLENSGWSGTQEQLDRLRAHADDAVDAEPGNVHYRYHRALYTWRMSAQQFDRGSDALTAAARDVVAQLHTARRLCPTYGPIYSVLGQIEHVYLGLPTGLQRLETATRLEPNDPNVWFAAGRADARRGDYPAANRKFQRAMDLDYSIIYPIFDLYLDELQAPEPAIEMVEGHWYRMHIGGNALMARPQHRELGSTLYKRGEALLAEETARKKARENSN